VRLIVSIDYRYEWSCIDEDRLRFRRFLRTSENWRAHLSAATGHPAMDHPNQIHDRFIGRGDLLLLLRPGCDRETHHLETDTRPRRAMRWIRFLIFASSLKVRGEAIVIICNVSAYFITECNTTRLVDELLFTCNAQARFAGSANKAHLLVCSLLFLIEIASRLLHQEALRVQVQSGRSILRRSAW
jgi:hypothetical protein